MDTTIASDPPVEYDSMGRDTGVELETATESDGIDEPFDPAKIDVVTRTPTVSLLLARLRRGVLELTPDFQRRAGIWTDAAQSRLIESLLLRIPLPTLYAAESGEESWVIVDGIQRLTSIARFVDAKLVAEPYGSDEPLRLHGLEYLKAHEGKTYEELPGSLKTRIEETELLVHLIRSGTPEPVKFNIFARINTGGLPLTAQELRHALIPGPARALLADLADSREFVAATASSIRKDRMADREMVLRFLAFRTLDSEEAYRGDLDQFLREAMIRINQINPGNRSILELDFKRSMISSIAIFGEYAFRKRRPEAPAHRLPVNKALFEAIAVNLARLSEKDVGRIINRRQVVEKQFIDLMDDGAFFTAISVGTGDIEKVRRRFGVVRELFERNLT